MFIPTLFLLSMLRGNLISLMFSPRRWKTSVTLLAYGILSCVLIIVS